MISSKNIRFHSPSNTYIIPKNSILDQNVAVKGNLIVGPGTRFWKNVRVDGNIQLGKGCIVEGHLKASQIIVGSRSKLKGNVTADSDISLFQNVAVNSIESEGNITIMPGCVVGYANGNTLSVIGKAEIKKIGLITKVTVRANTVAELEDEPESSDSDSGFAVDKIDFNDSHNLQNISEELIFEDNIIDETKIESVSAYNNKNEVGNHASLDSLSTPTLPMENVNENTQIDVETRGNSEKSDAEIIDETDKISPKSFTVSEFACSSANNPINVPTDESSEVEIVSDSDDLDSDSNVETIFQTVETPFGTIVVGEHPSQSSTNATPLNPSDNQFASVMESTRDEQQADFEAEMKIKSEPFDQKSEFVDRKSESVDRKSEPAGRKSESVDRKSEFKWPSFEPKKVSKTEKEATKPFKTTKTAVSANNNLFGRKVSPHIEYEEIEYEEIKIQTLPKQKERENLSNPKQTIVSGKASSKIIFEEIGGNEPAKPQTIQKPKSKVDLLMGNMNFDAVAEKPAEAKLSAEKKVRTQEEIERSKAWYEERYPQAESKKKEYPPYV